MNLTATGAVIAPRDTVAEGPGRQDLNEGEERTALQYLLEPVTQVKVMREAGREQ